MPRAILRSPRGEGQTTIQTRDTQSGKIVQRVTNSDSDNPQWYAPFVSRPIHEKYSAIFEPSQNQIRCHARRNPVEPEEMRKVRSGISRYEITDEMPNVQSYREEETK